MRRGAVLGRPWGDKSLVVGVESHVERFSRAWSDEGVRYGVFVEDATVAVLELGVASSRTTLSRSGRGGLRGRGA
jgi:hypothetical protein